MKLPAILFLLLFPVLAWAAAPTWTTNTIGPNGTGSYSSIASWEDAVDGNLTEAGNNTVQVGEIFGDWTGTNDTTTVDFDGSTTDATHFMMVYTTSAARHKGEWSTAYYNLSVANAALDISDPYVVIDGLQIEETSSGSRTVLNRSTGGTYPTIRNCILRCDSAGTSSILFGFPVGAGGGLCYNCFLINRATAGTGLYDNSSAGASMTNINLTITNAAAAGAATSVMFANSAQSTANTLINCIFAGFSSNDTRTGAPTAYSGYNATTAGSMYKLGDSGNTGDRISQTFTFTNTANCHLASTDAGARTYGTSAYSGIFNTDIDGETRPATWDIGCDQYVSATPPSGAARVRRIFRTTP